MTSAGDSMAAEKEFRRHLAHLYDQLAYLNTTQSLFLDVSIDADGPPKIWDLIARLRTDIDISVEVRNEKLATVEMSMLSGRPILHLAAGNLTFPPQLNQSFPKAIWHEAELHTLGDQTPNFLRPRPRSLVEAAPWADGTRAPAATLDAFAALAAFRRTVILGPPGSGKSTVLKAIAAAQLGPLGDPVRPGSHADLGVWRKLVPVFLEAKELVSNVLFPKIGILPNIDVFDSFVRQEVMGGSPQSWAFLEENLLRGEAVILIDGLDEIPIPTDVEAGLEERRKQIQALISSVSVRYSDCPIIISSRPSGYSDWMLPAFQTVRLRPLGEVEASEIITRVESLLGVKPEVDLRRRLQSELDRVPEELREQPIFLTLLVLLFHKGHGSLPSTRGSLIDEALTLLVGSWTESRLGGQSIHDLLGCSESQVLDRLEMIAFRAHTAPATEDAESANIDRGLILDELFELGVNPAKVLDFISSHAGILVSPKPRQYKFAHRLFQEFLAARHVSHSKSIISELWPRLAANPSQWTEVGLLVGDILLGEDREGDLWDLVFGIFEVGRADIDAGRLDSGHLAMWFVSRLIIDNSLHMRRSLIREAYILELRVSLPNSLKSPILDATARVDIGVALGLLGDTRPGVGVTVDNTPDIEWCNVGEGLYKIGSSPEDAVALSNLAMGVAWDISRESPSDLVALSAFRIARFPVTVAQFRCFLERRDGYYQDRWWNESGVRWRNVTPRSIDIGANRVDNYPVTQVTLYEAQAFCAWLSQILGLPCRLPTEAEWEAACRWGTGSVFPWGDLPNPSLLNVRETGVASVAPVGCFPSLDTFSPEDMLGNIWEWCSSAVEHLDGRKFGYPYSALDGREDFSADPAWMYAARGGYYRNSQLIARPGFRGRDLPSHSSTRLGFRVCTGG